MAEILRERPSFYENYICTGNSGCFDVCCNAWIIPMDKRAADLYNNYPGETGEYLRENIYHNEKDEWFIKLHEDGRCPFLTENDLCGVRLKAGEDAQILICDVYPREKDIKAGYFRFDTLMLSCCEVGRIFYKETGDRLEFVRTKEKNDEPEISPELRERTDRLLAFRDGMVEAIQNGAYDRSLFETRESVDSIKKILDDAIYFENNRRSEEVFALVRKLIPESDSLLDGFIKEVPDIKIWMRKTAAYFAARNLLDTFQDGNLEGPLMSVFRSIHILMLISLAIYKDKGSFDVEDMIEGVHIFGNIFIISMHNISLLKEIRNKSKDEEYILNENSEMRPYLYP